MSASEISTGISAASGGIDAAGKAIALLERYFPALAMRRDQVEMRVWENRLAILDKVQAKVAAVGIEKASKVAPLSFLVNSWARASLEEDDALREKWANLLANSVLQTSEAEARIAYASLLAEMSAYDVRVLEAIYRVLEGATDGGGINTGGLPDNPTLYKKDDETPMPDERTQVSLSNLARLGCINVGTTWWGHEVLHSAFPTALGAAFVNACKTPRAPT